MLLCGSPIFYLPLKCTDEYSFTLFNSLSPFSKILSFSLHRPLSVEVSSSSAASAATIASSISSTSAGQNKVGSFSIRHVSMASTLKSSMNFFSATYLFEKIELVGNGGCSHLIISFHEVRGSRTGVIIHICFCLGDKEVD